MKRILLLALLLFAPAGLWAATTALFTSVTGQVTVKDAKDKATRTAQKDATAEEGETISAGVDAQASLQLFDGSKLDISPNTTFVLEKMQQPSLKDKVIHFKLELGKLFATVKKLATAKSSFEIEAGGVVCGVRGTEFFTAYDPSTHKVDVFVVTGTVFSQVGDQIHNFPAGHGGSYLGGSWNFTTQPPGNNPPPHSQNPPPSNPNPHPGFIASNPFYGFNGNGSDDFNNHLTNLPGGLPGITGTLGNNGVAGLNNHIILNLQLGFPQYLP